MFDFAGDNPGGFQNAQMLRNRGLCKPDLVDDVAADAALLLEEQCNNPDASRVCQCLCKCRKVIFVKTGRDACADWLGFHG